MILLALAKLSNITDPKMQGSASDQEPTIIFEPTQLKSADFWEETSVILINASASGVDAQNWTWVESQAWFGGGVGNSTDPYLIENLTITVSDAANAGLTILNNGSFFILNNITILNDAGDGLYLTGENGTITDSVFNSNGAYGIYIINANYTTISGVNCSLNANAGLYMENCVLNTIDVSYFNENTEDGLVMINSTYNEITSSYFMENTEDGLYIEDSDLNNFTVEADSNDRGLVLIDSDECIITDSEFWDNTIVGILLTEDDGDTVDNLIYNNILSGNTINGADNSTTNDWDNGVIGNSWSDYIGLGTPLDGDDDGIGDDGAGSVVPYDVSGTAGAIDNFPIYDDGPEPNPSLSDDDDADELFEDEKNAPGINWYLVGIITAIAITTSIAAFLLLTKRIKLPSSRKLKRTVRKPKPNVRSTRRQSRSVRKR